MEKKRVGRVDGKKTISIKIDTIYGLPATQVTGFRINLHDPKKIEE